MQKLTDKITRLPQWCLPLLLMLLGSLVRLAALGRIPEGLHQDETFVAWNAFALYHEGMDSAGHRLPVYLADWGDGHSALYSWLTIPLIALNGGHVNPFLSRLPQAVVSIFTLLAVYLLIRRAMGRQPALWALFLLAVCPWHIMMSRWGLDANLAPGFLIFGLTFFVYGLDKQKYLLLSALFYGLSLYCYAVIWPIVPIMLLLQILYALRHKRLHIDKWCWFSALLLFLLALPLLLFVLVNSDHLAPIALPFITIPKMPGYRGSEIAMALPRMWRNFRTTLSLLWHQNLGMPYDILLPWGLFYDIGRVFIVVGVFSLLAKVGRSFLKREFCYEYFIFVQLVGGGITCLLVTAVLHQINSLYIPLVLSEAYGVYTLLRLVGRHAAPLFRQAAAGALAGAYLVCLLLFQRDYYTDYRMLVGAYFAQGVEECVDFAIAQCHETGIRTISVEKGAQWPRLLLYTETLPSDYLASVTYDVAPAPAAFTTHGLRINTRIHYDTIGPESIYIFYYTDVPVFEKDFHLTQFHDWYVAVPKQGITTP